MAAGTESRPADSTAKPPKDDTIAQLSRIWQDLLGLDSVEPDQNYFDLGGDSLLAVQMFAQIEKSFNVNLPLATLFDAPTIEELAQILRQECATPKWSPVVPIQTSGTKPPLFCMHGARGNVLMYRGLSQHLGDDQPFYGLQCQGLDGSCLPFTRVEDMAALYVKEIRKVQPKGPYFLGGYCLGGTIALEMAQQLVASGERVAMLALFDTMNWSRLPTPRAWQMCYLHAQRLAFHAANFLGLSFSDKRRFFREKLAVLRSRIPVWGGKILNKFHRGSSMGRSQSAILGRIWSANDFASINYVPKPYPGVITDIRPVKQYRMFSRPELKWGTLALRGVEVIVLPVYPAGMLVEPYVPFLAKALNESIRRNLQSR